MRQPIIMNIGFALTKQKNLRKPMALRVDVIGDL